MSHDRFKRNFRLSRDTFEWLIESLENCPVLIPENIGKGGGAVVSSKSKSKYHYFGKIVERHHANSKKLKNKTILYTK